ncbi:MAG: hypothetical protein EAX96_06170 [Candidatus Lokiarchaeota archaeon]|nr:hypothetical protein [Candidatus Lokiarchaeota archaeon]
MEVFPSKIQKYILKQNDETIKKKMNEIILVDSFIDYTIGLDYRAKYLINYLKNVNRFFTGLPPLNNKNETYQEWVYRNKLECKKNHNSEKKKKIDHLFTNAYS